MHGLAPIIIDLAIILCIAGIVTVLFQWIKQPVVLGYIVAGIIIGPHTPPYSFLTDTGNIQVLAELGVIFLMFALGLEFSFHKLRRAGMGALIIAVVEVSVMLAVGYWIGILIGWSPQASLFLGAALSISSTTIIIKAIDELKLKQEKFAQLIFAVLIVEDLLAILLLVMLSTSVSEKNALSYDIIWSMTKLILVVGSWFLIGYFIIPTLMRKVGGFISDETLTIVSIGLCLLLVVAAAFMNYSVALGAFMMGSILAETPQGHRIAELIYPIRDIFAAVFFVTVGMLIDFNVMGQDWMIIILITLVTIVGKVLASGIGAIIAGKDIKTSTQVGCGLAQIGEFSFIIAGLGIALGVTDSRLYGVIVVVSVLTTFTTPYFIRASALFSDSVAAALPAKAHLMLKRYSDHRSMLQPTKHIHQNWRVAIARYLVNALVVAIVFSISAEVLMHLLFNFSYHWLILAWLITIILASPFLSGMLFAYHGIREQVKLPIVTGFFSWMLAMLEVAVLSDIYFHSWIVVLISLLSLFICVYLFQKPLLRVYNWFAQHLMANIEAGKQHIND